jgi:hypothetical protein
MSDINEFKNNDNGEELSFSDKIRLIKLNNPGKFDHLPDPVKRPQKWSNDEYQKILKTIKEKGCKDDENC